MNRYLRFGLILALTAGCCFAQSTLDTAGIGISGMVTRLAKYFCICVLVFCGIGIAAGGTHMAGKIGGAVVGVIVALGATALIGWMQGLVGG